MTHNTPTSIEGEFTPTNGTMYFYGLINSIVETGMVFVDLGAGRGGWHEDAPLSYSRRLRLMRGKVREVIAADVDPVVMENRSSDRNVLIEDGKLPLNDESVDVIVSDFVMEHIADVASFTAEIDRLLKPGGWLCARTPHKSHYVSFAARLLPERVEDWLLSKLQPGRKSIDVFPKVYRLNTLAAIHEAFPDYDNSSFIFRAAPAYDFGSKWVYAVMSFVHRIMPAAFSGNIFVFIRKPHSGGGR